MSNTIKLAGLLAVALGTLFLATRPSQLPSFMLIMPFALIFLLSLMVVRAGLQRIGIAGGNLGMAVLVAGLPVVLLAMQSLGQLTVRDIIMISTLFTIAYFYMYRRARSSN